MSDVVYDGALLTLNPKFFEEFEQFGGHHNPHKEPWFRIGQGYAKKGVIFRAKSDARCRGRWWDLIPQGYEWSYYDAWEIDPKTGAGKFASIVDVPLVLPVPPDKAAHILSLEEEIENKKQELRNFLRGEGRCFG